MQLLPSTAAEVGIPFKKLKNPHYNIRGGSKYYGKLFRRYGRDDVALAAYNWGRGNIDRLLRSLEKQGVQPTLENMQFGMPEETGEYIANILRTTNLLTENSTKQYSYK